MRFLKEHLLLDHYSWSENNKAHLFSETASRRIFNRFSGDQVLFIINLCVDGDQPSAVVQGQQLEKKLLHELPLEPKSELSVYNWLMNSQT